MQDRTRPPSRSWSSPNAWKAPGRLSLSSLNCCCRRTPQRQAEDFHPRRSYHNAGVSWPTAAVRVGAGRTPSCPQRDPFSSLPSLCAERRKRREASPASAGRRMEHAEMRQLSSVRGLTKRDSSHPHAAPTPGCRLHLTSLRVRLLLGRSPDDLHLDLAVAEQLWGPGGGYSNLLHLWSVEPAETHRLSAPGQGWNAVAIPVTPGWGPAY